MALKELENYLMALMQIFFKLTEQKFVFFLVFPIFSTTKPTGSRIDVAAVVVMSILKLDHAYTF